MIGWSGGLGTHKSHKGFVVRASGLNKYLHSRKLTWKPKKGPVKTTVLLQGDYRGFHVSLGERRIGVGGGGFEGRRAGEIPVVAMMPQIGQGIELGRLRCW